MEAPTQDFSSQNQTILTILLAGGSINRIEAIEKYRITALNSRISDLKNRQGITGIVGKWEPGSKCKRYSLVIETSQAV